MEWQKEERQGNSDEAAIRTYQTLLHSFFHGNFQKHNIYIVYNWK